MPPIYSKQAAKYLSVLDASSQKRIKFGILKIPLGDIKPLQGAPGNFRLHVGDWRILFDYTDEKVVRIKK